MMEKMTSKEICKLLEIIIGETEPVADSAVDQIREENLKTLIDVGNWVLDGLLYAAEHRKDPYYAVRQLGKQRMLRCSNGKSGLQKRRKNWRDE